MKPFLNSTAVSNTSHFPVGITGAIVSSDWGGDAVDCSCESNRDNSTHFQTRLASETGEFMNTGNSKSLDRRAWRKSYTAALFEIDKTKLAERIAHAEKALALRARELFYAAGDNIEAGTSSG